MAVSSSFGVSSEIAFLPNQGKILCSNLLMMLSECLVDQVEDCFLCHSRATTSKLFAAFSSCESFCAFLLSLGLTPSASSFLAASRRSRAFFHPRTPRNQLAERSYDPFAPREPLPTLVDAMQISASPTGASIVIDRQSVRVQPNEPNQFALRTSATAAETAT